MVKSTQLYLEEMLFQSFRSFLMIGFLLFAFSFSSFTSYAGSKEDVVDYFSEEIKLSKLPLSFDILWSSYGEFPVSLNGTKIVKKFFLKRFDIVYHKNRVFEITLYFLSVLGNSTFSERFSLPFFDGGNFVVFKTVYGKKKFLLPEETIELRKTEYGFKVYRYFPETTLEIPVERGKIFLVVKRKR